MIVALVSQLATFVVSAKTANLLTNASSKGTVSGWECWAYNDEGYAILDDDVKYSGTSSLKAVNPTPYGANLYMDLRTYVSVQAGKTYRYGAMIKAQEASSATLAMGEATKTSITPVKPSYDWQKIELTYTANTTGAVQILFKFEDVTKAVWIDDVFCYEYADGQYVGKNLVSNSNFDGIGAAGPSSSEEEASDSASAHIAELQKKYEAVRSADEFDVEELLPVVGNFKFIPLYENRDINIDGDLSDWEKITAISLPTNSEQYRFYMDNVTPDISAQLKLAYDETNLYVAVSVKDDVICAQDDSTCWKGDSLQMAIGTSAEQYGFEVNFVRNPETGKGKVYSSYLDDFDREKIVVETSKIDDEVIYEIAIPWKIRWAEIPENVLFDVLINDNDGDGRAYVVELAPGIAEGKTNLEFPLVEIVDSETAWYTWTEGSRNVENHNEEVYDFYIVNEGDEREFLIMPPNGDETERVKIAKGKGIHRQYTVAFEEYGSKKVSTVVECDGVRKEAAVDIKVTPSAEDYTVLLADVDTYISEISDLIGKCEAANIVPAYEKANYAVLQYFRKGMEQDIENRDFSWVTYNFECLTEIYNTAKENLTAYLKGEKTPYAVPEYVISDIEAVGCVEYATTVTNGVEERRPYFFVGGGHFGASPTLMKSFGGSVVNLGDHWPSMLVFNSDGTPTLNLNAYSFLSGSVPQFEEAEEANVRMGLLLGAEKFMSAVARKYPETTVNNGTAMNFCSDKLKELARDEMELFIQEILKYKAIDTIIIMNEPSFHQQDKYYEYQPYWALYLSEIYNGDINYLNETYGTSYSKFKEVERPAEPEATPQYYDWQKFNNDIIAEYCGIISDVIREYAPHITTSVKMRPLSSCNDSHKHIFLDYGAGIEQLAQVTTVNGCDAHGYYNRASWEPHEKSQMYDMLRGIRWAPVYNTEDHIIVDQNQYTGYEQADHVEGDIWQGAIHGRVLSNIWGFEKKTSPTDVRYGLFMSRPDCIEAMGRTAMDLNRLSWEVAAFANKKPRAAILYSITGRVYDKPSMAASYSAYTTLLTNGETVKYISDTTSQDMFECETVIIPNTVHTPAEVVDNLYEFVNRGGKVVLLGRDCLKYDEHNYPNDEEKVKFITDNAKTVDLDSTGYVLTKEDNARIEAGVIEAVREMGQPVVLIDAATGEVTEDIEYTSVEYDGKTFVNVISYKDWGEDTDIKILYNGAEVEKCVNRRTDEGYSSTVTLEPSIPLLLELNAGDGAPSLPFNDIAKHWGKNNILKLYEKNMVAGKGNGSFEPNSDITVAEFIKMTENALGMQETAYTADIADVDAGAWYATAVQTASDARMIDALVKNNELSPDRAITREEMCYVLVRAYEYMNKTVLSEEEISSADAAEIDELFSQEVSKAYANGIVHGTDNNRFAPKDNATRAEAVTIICNMLSL